MRKKINELYGRIRKTSQRKIRNKQDAEDIFQEVVLSYIKKPDSKQTIDQAIIDASRCYGLTERRCGSDALASIRRQKGRSMVEIENRNFSQCPQDDLLNFESSLFSLKKAERIIIILKYKYGFRGKEISYLFNVTESRIAQILKEVLNKISLENGQ